MSIRVTCATCGKTLNAPDSAAGKKGKCPGCGNILLIEAPVEEVQLTEAAPQAAPTPAPPPPSPAQPTTPTSALRSMQCQSCGGTVEYQDGQGLFKCKYCGSVYESEAAAGGFSIKTVKLVEKMAGDLSEMKDMQREKRLQEQAATVQDKIDYKFIEFDNSTPKKVGAAAPILWIVGIGFFLVSTPKGSPNVLIGLLVGGALIGIGVLCFMHFKTAQAAFEAECEEMRQKELEPIYDKLRQIGAVMADGTVSLGYKESTAIPQRYCVMCHKNITPQKVEGGSFAGLSGINLMLTVFTCGLWLPAWFFIEIMARGGRLAGRSFQKGTCPSCGNKSLLPARVPA